MERLPTTHNANHDKEKRHLPRYLFLFPIIGDALTIALLAVASRTMDTPCPHTVDISPDRSIAVCDHNPDATKMIKDGSFDVFTDSGMKTFTGEYLGMWSDTIYFVTRNAHYEQLWTFEEGDTQQVLVSEWFDDYAHY